MQGTSVTPKVKGLGARLLQGLSMSSGKKNFDEKPHHISRKDLKSVGCDYAETTTISKEDVSNKLVTEKSGTKKIRLLGKYFQVHKRLCIPIPGLFANNRNRLYKAQSCSSLTREKININSETMVRCRQRAVSVIRNSLGSDGDINQNMEENEKARRKSSTVVQLNNVCNELTGICAVHLGQASKCCSFC